MNEKVNETVGQAIYEAAYKHQQSKVVGNEYTFTKVTTISGVDELVEWAFSLLSGEKIELVSGVHVQVSRETDIKIKRDMEKISLSFQPAPKLQVKISKPILNLVRMNSGLLGVHVWRHEAKLLLQGLPDIRIGLE